jgi:hypothetical protein
MYCDVIHYANRIRFQGYICVYEGGVSIAILVYAAFESIRQLAYNQLRNIFKLESIQISVREIHTYTSIATLPIHINLIQKVLWKYSWLNNHE